MADGASHGVAAGVAAVGFVDGAIASSGTRTVNTFGAGVEDAAADRRAIQPSDDTIAATPPDAPTMVSGIMSDTTEQSDEDHEAPAMGGRHLGRRSRVRSNA